LSLEKIVRSATPSAWDWPRPELLSLSTTHDNQAAAKATLQHTMREGRKTQIYQGAVGSWSDIQMPIYETVQGPGQLDIMANDAGMESRK
jgi:hypothetical protein